jgi:hypothetical protein
MPYEIGWHASDDEFCHVTLVSDDRRIDLFDVALYDSDVTEANGKSARDNSETALRTLVGAANRGVSFVDTLDALVRDVIADAIKYRSARSGEHNKEKARSYEDILTDLTELHASIVAREQPAR